MASYPILRQITCLENLHAGEECYIFGDGSSIKKFELSAFADKVGIAVNAIPRHKDARQLNLRYWIVAEAGFFLPPFRWPPTRQVEGFRNRLRFQSFYRRQPRDSAELVQITSLTNLLGLWRNHTYYFWDRLPRSRRDHGSPRTDSPFLGSICAAITLAQYLGFRRAILVGMDHTHNPATGSHWYDNRIPRSAPQIPGMYHREFFEIMMKHIEIVTVTPTPQLTELPSIDYKSLTGHDLCYRENIELLTREDLEILALNPGYNIF